MQLRFYAKCGAKNHPPPLVHWPGLKSTGTFVRYVGRTLDPKTRVYRADKEPVAVDSESEAGKRFAKICRRDHDLWPADEATAKFCGQPFVALKQDADGEWRPAAEASKPSSKKGDS